MTTNYPLTTEEFRIWLESKDKNAIVGWQSGCKCCPIFNCLKYRNNDVISVNGTTTCINHELLENPPWVEKFISKVDCLVIPIKQGEMNVSISAKEALKVLEEAEIECT